MGNRELKDPLIFKDFKAEKMYSNFTALLARNNFMAPSNNSNLPKVVGAVTEEAPVA